MVSRISAEFFVSGQEGKWAREETLSFLKSLRSKQALLAKYGIQAFDPAIVEELERFDLLPGVENVYAFLFSLGVSSSVLEMLYQHLNERKPRGLAIPPAESYIKDYFFGPNLISWAELEFKRDLGGAEWLRSFIADNKSDTRIDFNMAHRLLRLARDVEARYGFSAAAMAVLSFMTMRKSETSTGAPITAIERLVNARVDELPPGKELEKENFFTHLRDFFGVYADITAKVIERTADPKEKDRIEKKARNALSHFLKLRDFSIAYSDLEEKPPNPFDVFQKMLLEDPRMNPWLEGSFADTPFDISKFGHLFSQDVPRGLVADAIGLLRKDKLILLAQDITALLKSIASLKQRAPDENLVQKIKETADQALALTGSDTRGPVFEDIQSQIGILERFVSENASGLHPFAVLLRMIDPEKIVTNHAIAQEFLALLKRIPAGLKPENPRDIKKMRILAASVQDLLAISSPESADPFFDIPLMNIDGYPSLNMLFTTRANRWFDRKILTEGPYAHEPELRGRKPRGPLIVPRDVADMSPERLERLGKNFNTAAGTKLFAKREWIHRASRAWGDVSKAYEHILNFTTHQIEKYWGINCKNGEYTLGFFPNATSAFRELVRSLMPPMSAEDYMIISTEENDSMTEEFVNQGVRLLAVDCRNRTAQEIFERIVTIIKSQKKDPAAFLLSTKTRFGDAIGSTDGDRSSVGFGLLCSKLEKRCPKALIAADRCQSTGRNDLGENTPPPGCHVLLTSGGKALGVENVGVVAIRKVPEGKEHWLAHHSLEVQRNPFLKLGNTKGAKHTLELERIARIGVALQWLMSPIDTWKGSMDSRTQQERQAVHMMEMDTYSIYRKIIPYATTLVQRDDFPFADEARKAFAADTKVQEQFGCQVIDPAHRHKLDFNGALTVAFPSIGFVSGTEKDPPLRRERDTYLKRELEKRGFLVERELSGGHGVRISSHYNHEQKNINALFAAIQDIHVAFLNDLVKRKQIKDFAGLQKEAPNLPDGWLKSIRREFAIPLATP